MTTSRVLGAATAVLLLAATATAATAAAPAPDREHRSGLLAGTSTVSARVDGRRRRRPLAARGLARRQADRVHDRGGRPTITPTGAPSQNFVSVSVVQRRAPSTVGATVVLGAAPDAGTRSKVIVAFGRLSTDGGTCSSPAGNNFSFPTLDADPDVDNPVYDGATITVRPFVLPVARNATWNCAFAKAVDLPPDPDTPPEGITYHQVTAASLKETIQKPILSIVVKGRDLRPGRFTEVPIRISNSGRTIATAPDVRLTWRTTRVTVRAVQDFGSIRPDTGKRSSFFIKRTAKGPAQVTFTATSRNYRKSVTLKLEPGG